MQIANIVASGEIKTILANYGKRKMEKITAYKCQYCGKLFETLEKGHLHEEYGCRKNKNAFNCNDCMWVIKGEQFFEKSRCGKGHKISFEQFSKCRDRRLEWQV